MSQDYYSDCERNKLAESLFPTKRKRNERIELFL